MKQFKGKAIYTPTGKAGEYSKWACNFFTGCSNDCSYCFCKRGFLSSVWSKEAKLKTPFQDEEHALQIFEKELLKNIDEIRASGLFFTFTSDPYY
jgi:DNA repair photolyase